MIKSQFYSHLIDIDIIYNELDSLNLSEKEKEELKEHIHGSIHYTVLDIVMSEIPKEHKNTFLHHVIQGNHSEVWNLLKKTTENIEDKVKKTSESIIKGFLKDISRVRKN